MDAIIIDDGVINQLILLIHNCTSCNDIKKDYYIVGLQLKISLNKLELLQEFAKEVDSIVMWIRLLRSWKKDKADYATLENFARAMKDSGYEEIKNAICKSFESGMFHKTTDGVIGASELGKQRSKFVQEHISTLCKLTYWTPSFFQQLQERNILSGSEVESLTIDTTDTVNGNKLLQFYMLICKKLLNCPKLYNDLICTLKILQSGPASDFLKQIDLLQTPGLSIIYEEMVKVRESSQELRKKLEFLDKDLASSRAEFNMKFTNIEEKVGKIEASLTQFTQKAFIQQKSDF